MNPEYFVENTREDKLLGPFTEMEALKKCVAEIATSSLDQKDREWLKSVLTGKADVYHYDKNRIALDPESIGWYRHIIALMTKNDGESISVLSKDEVSQLYENH